MQVFCNSLPVAIYWKYWSRGMSSRLFPGVAFGMRFISLAILWFTASHFRELLVLVQKKMSVPVKWYQTNGMCIVYSISLDISTISEKTRKTFGNLHALLSRKIYAIVKHALLIGTSNFISVSFIQFFGQSYFRFIYILFNILLRLNADVFLYKLIVFLTISCKHFPSSLCCPFNEIK